MKTAEHDKGGYVSIKALFWVLVFAFAIYAGFKVVPPYFAYYMMKYEVASEAKNAHMYSDEVITDHIMKKAEYWSVPVKRENIRITRNAFEIEIALRYNEKLNFFDRYKRTLDFRITVVKPIKETTGVLH